jgi:hypothetical protein
MREMTDLELLEVVGGTKSCCCEGGKSKGNNGWGNGAEGTNPGSDEGGTAGSKSDEVWDEGDGPRPGKHDHR